MKFIIISLLGSITIHCIANAHENHDHEIYNWPNSKSNTYKKDSIFNIEKKEYKKNKTTTNIKSSLIKFFRREKITN